VKVRSVRVRPWSLASRVTAVCLRSNGVSLPGSQSLSPAATALMVAVSLD